MNSHADLLTQQGDLLRQQRQWLRALIAPVQTPLGDDELQRWSGGIRPASHALAVYINNIRANVLNALRLSYPVTLAQLGSACFAQAVISGLRIHPPRSGDLSDYGAWLPEQLAALATTPEEAHSWRALAELEWHVDQAASVSQPAPLTLQAFAALADGDQALPQVTLRTPWQLLTLPAVAWHALARHQDQLQGQLRVLHEPDPECDEQTHIHLLQQGTQVLVVSSAASDWLSALAETADLEAATQGTLAQHPDLPLPALLQALLVHEVLTLRIW
jgi:hypothetical protein